MAGVTDGAVGVEPYHTMMMFFRPGLVSEESHYMQPTANQPQIYDDSSGGRSHGSFLGGFDDVGPNATDA